MQYKNCIRKAQGIIINNCECNNCIKQRKGCWICDYLDYYEAYPEESSPSGWMCNYKEVEHFKTFPCNRRLKCFKRRK